MNLNLSHFSSRDELSCEQTWTCGGRLGGRAPQEAKFLTPPRRKKWNSGGGGQKFFEAFYLVKNLKYFWNFDPPPTFLKRPPPGKFCLPTYGCELVQIPVGDLEHDGVQIFCELPILWIWSHFLHGYFTLIHRF